MDYLGKKKREPRNTSTHTWKLDLYRTCTAEPGFKKKKEGLRINKAEITGYLQRKI